MDFIRENWILQFPDISQGLSFTTRTVTFLVALLVLATSALMCFKGYKLFQATFIFMAAILLGLWGAVISERFTDSLLFKMVFFVMFAFMGVCLLFFASVIWGYVARVLRIMPFLSKHLYLISSILGALAFGCALYFMVFRSAVVASVLCVVLCAGGIAYQFRHKDQVVKMYTYDDLLKLPRKEDAS